MTPAYTPPHSQRAVSQATKPRIEFIDTAKGFCILMVVLLHCNLFSEASHFLGMLRMPFYFTLSGLFFKDYGGVLPTIIKKCNKILIPFFFFYTISFFVIIGIQITAGVEVNASYTAFIHPKEALSSINYALWFLLALFWANMLFMIIRSFSTNLVFLGGVSFTLSILSLFLFSGDTKLPLYFDSALAALPYFFMGYCMRNTGILLPNKYDRYSWLLILLLISIVIVAFTIGNHPYISIGGIKIQGNPAMFGIASISFVFVMMLLCKKMGPLPFIKYIGRYSLIILGLHVTIINIANLALRFIGIRDESSLHCIIIFAIVTGICTIMIKPLTKWFPKYTAQQDLITWRSAPAQKYSSVPD